MKKTQEIRNSEGLKFLAIGGVNTTLDFVILFLLKWLGLNEIIANSISTGITFILSFILNKKITFESNRKSNKKLFREIILFTIVTLFGLWVIQSGIIIVSKPIFLSVLNNITIFNNIAPKESLALLFSKIIATAFSMVWNFILYKKIVFKK